MTSVDIPEVLDIADACGLEPWSEQGYTDELVFPGSIMLTARENKDLAGFITGRSIAGEAEIYNIAVSPAFRRRGIGQGLIEAFAEKAKAERIFLEVRSQNRTAIVFYEKAGFSPFATRRNFYSNPPDDAIVMERQDRRG